MPALPLRVSVITRQTLLALALPMLAGCSTAPLVREAEDLVQGMLVRTRTTGDRRLADAATVSRELACGTPGAAAARLEDSSVLPERPKAGREVAHRIVLAACPLAPELMTGTLTRRVSHQGRTLFEDSMPYTLKPGRWSVDVFVGIPAQARPGPYRLAVQFVRRGVRLETASDFAVAAP